MTRQSESRFIDSLGQLIKITREGNFNLVINKLIAFSSAREEELRDIAGLGPHTIV